VTPAEADWVYDVVLTRAYKESVGAIMWTGAGVNRRDEGQGAAFLRTCPCLWGPCGACADGRPDRCGHFAWSPAASPATHIVDRHKHAVAEVWSSGKPCRGLCTGAPIGQLELFALAGGAS
jgi:hypothetical protein